MIKNLNISKTVLTVLLFATSSVVGPAFSSYQAKTLSLEETDLWGDENESDSTSVENFGNGIPGSNHRRKHTVNMTIGQGLPYIRQRVKDVTKIDSDAFDKLKNMLHNTQEAIDKALEGSNEKVGKKKERALLQKQIVDAFKEQEKKYLEVCDKLKNLHVKLDSLNKVISSKDKEIGSLQIDFSKKQNELEELEAKLSNKPDDKGLLGKIEAKKKQLDEVNQKIAKVWDQLHKTLSSEFGNSRFGHFFASGFGKIKDIFSKKKGEEKIEDAEEAENFFSKAKNELINELLMIEKVKTQTAKLAKILVNKDLEDEDEKKLISEKFLNGEFDGIEEDLRKERSKNRRLSREVGKLSDQLKKKKKRQNPLKGNSSKKSSGFLSDLGIAGVGMGIGGFGMYAVNSLTEGPQNKQQKNTNQSQQQQQQKTEQEEMEGEDVFDMVEGNEN